jgi:hypothetical protein
VGTDKSSQLFDEQAALQALEQLRGQIQDARARREQKLAEFDAFVRSNRAASHAERLAALGEPPLERPQPTLQTAARNADRARDPALPARREILPRATPPSSVRLDAEEPYDFPPVQRDLFGDAIRAWQRLPVRVRAGAGIAILILALVAIGKAVVGPQAAEDAPQSTAGSAPPSAAAAHPSAAPASAQGAGPDAPQSAPPSPPAHALEIELTTVRPVWMRITVDGERRVEREVPGDQKLAFGANRAIVVRAGDGSAVRLSVNGADKGLLGRPGFPITRTLTPGQ